MCFAVGFLAVVQYGLGENKEVVRSGAGDAQGKLCTLQRVADYLVCGFRAVIHLASPVFSLGEGKWLNESMPGMRARLRPQSQSTWICPASSIHSTVPMEPGGTDVYKRQLFPGLEKVAENMQTLVQRQLTCHRGKLRQVCYKAVSYTHLDVYKRQCLDSVDCEQVPSVKDLYGTTHSVSYRFDASDTAWAKFKLDGQYDTFSANIVTSEDTNRDANMSVEIYLDDVLVGRVDDVVRDEHVRPISVSVNGGNVLMIKVIRTNSYYSSNAYICDTSLSVLQ